MHERTRTAAGAEVSSVAFSPDGKSVLTGSFDKTARLWDAATGKVIRAFTGLPGSIFDIACAWLPDYDLSGLARITASIFPMKRQSARRMQLAGS